MSINYDISRFLNALWIYLIASILTGGFIYEFINNQAPCPLCMLQRLSMVMVVIGPMLNLRFGIRPMHYGVALSGCLFGGAVSLRQISLHICPSFGNYTLELFGFKLYSWAFVTFAASAIGLILLLFLYRPEDKPSKKESRMMWHEKIAFFYIFLVTLTNVVTTYRLCLFGFCGDT